MRVIFMGTPDFAVPAFDAIRSAGHDIACVYTRPPRPAGRGQKERRSPVHERAADRGIQVRTPKSLKSPDEQEAFAALGAEVAVVVAYGLILPREILDATPHGCINIHASLLPRWRGAAPIQRAILAGDAETGVTIMQVEEGLDSGPMLRVGAAPITATTTAGELHDELAALGARLVVETLADVAEGRAVPLVQPEEGVTYAAKIDKAETRIDWSRPAEEVDRQVRAFSPFPGAWFEHDGERIKLLRTELVTATGAPGTVLADRLTVACGTGALRLCSLQRAGRGALDADAFLRGYDLAAGAILL